MRNCFLLLSLEGTEQSNDNLFHENEIKLTVKLLKLEFGRMREALVIELAGEFTRNLGISWTDGKVSGALLRSKFIGPGLHVGDEELWQLG